MPDPALPLDTLLRGVADRARGSGVFERVSVAGGRLACAPKAAAPGAEYRLAREDGRLYVSLVTPDRWLSESIETDLLHTGDDLVELIDEELADLGRHERAGACEHFRSEERLFTFRSPVPAGESDPGAAEVCAAFLLAYEACFRRLGDMDGSGEED